MAIESSSSSPTFPIFIDTNLNTHLSLLVNRDDSIADLRGKLMSEHARCFPNIGKISIEAFKVKRGEFFYHLSDSMVVRHAFRHIKGARFLHIDLAPVLIVKSKCQTEPDRVITSDNDAQLENCNTIQADHSTSLLARNGEVKHLEFVPKTIEQRPFPTSVSGVNESDKFPNAVEPTHPGCQAHYGLLAQWEIMGEDSMDVHSIQGDATFFVG